MATSTQPNGGDLTRLKLDEDTDQVVIYYYGTVTAQTYKTERGYKPKLVTPRFYWCGWQESNPRPLGS